MLLLLDAYLGTECSPCDPRIIDYSWSITVYCLRSCVCHGLDGFPKHAEAVLRACLRRVKGDLYEYEMHFTLDRHSSIENWSEWKRRCEIYARTHRNENHKPPVPNITSNCDIYCAEWLCELYPDSVCQQPSTAKLSRLLSCKVSGSMLGRFEAYERESDREREWEWEQLVDLYSALYVLANLFLKTSLSVMRSGRGERMETCTTPCCETIRVQDVSGTSSQALRHASLSAIELVPVK